jgi:hypothetical protein
MRKKTTMTLAIATILIAYISGVSLSNQAQGTGESIKQFHGPQQLLKALAGEEAQVLAGHETQLGKAGLGDVCLSCWGG